MAKRKYFEKFEINENGIRLFCFPYAGGGASVFRLWQEKLGNGIHVYPAHYPGHENRIMEEPVKDMDTLVTNLYKEMNEWVQHPFLLFGHSMGSRVAYELAARFEEDGNKTFLGIIVSAGLAPDRMETNPIYHLSDTDFFKELSRYNRTPVEIFKNKDLWSIFEPVLRADFTVADTYCDKKHRKIHVPMLALRGTSDLEVSQKDLQEWKEYTTAGFWHTEIEGGHLFIDTNTDKVLEIIKEYIIEIGKEKLSYERN